MSKKIKRNVEDRVGIIGGSQIGALLGYSKYQSTHDVWLTFMGKDKDKVISDVQKEIFEMGHQLEEFIAKQVERLHGVKLRKSNFAYVHPTEEWLICHPDRIVVGTIDGKRIGVEIKSSSTFDNDRWGDADTDDIPADYLCQCHDYIMCDVCDEVWLFRFCNNRLTRYIITKDEALEESILANLKAIIASFNEGVEPLIENTKEAHRYYNEPTDDFIEASDEITGIYGKWKELDAEKKRLENEIDGLKAKIICFMKDKKTLVTTLGDKMCTYSKVDSNRFDAKAFEKDHPELYVKYLQKSSYMKLS